MKTYLIDTNVFLRYLVDDSSVQKKQVNHYFKLARKQKIKLKVLSTVIPEIEYVLRKFYQVPREEIADKILRLLKIKDIFFENRKAWVDTFELYTKINIDPVDIFLYHRSLEEKAKVLTFDKDLQTVKRAAQNSM